ncbi:MAG: hypothetical protein ACFHHU_09800 [Porticoccaceae bacterium]
MSTNAEFATETVPAQIQALLTDCFVVVLGMSPTGLYAVREIGQAGISVYVADSGRLTAGYSRYLAASGGWIVADDDQQLLKRLLRLAETEKRPGILIPTSDKYIEFVVRHAESLAGGYRFQKSYSDGSYERIVDKGHFARLCAEHQIPHPQTLTLKGSELLQAEDQLRFPCILKPALIHLVRDYMAGQKVLIVRNREDFFRHVQKVAHIDADWMVQEVIPGPESRITLFGGYFDRSGKLSQAFTCRKLRQYPPGFGSASLVRSEILDETRTISEQFLQAVGFQGIAGTEFKYDERDRQLKMIEINPRPTLWFGCSHAAGKRIVLSAVADLMGEEPLADNPQEPGVEWRYLGKDLATRIYYSYSGKHFALPPENLSVYGHRLSRVWAVFSWRDPLPVVGEYLNYVRKFLRRMLHRVK